MIRAEHLIHKLCDLEALRDKAVAPQNRFDALRDAVNFALLTCMGEAPSRPERETSAAWPSPEALEYDRNVELYGRYTDFPEIGKAFAPPAIWQKMPSSKDSGPTSTGDIRTMPTPWK